MRQERHEITPEVAQRLLAANGSLNRSTRQSQIRFFSEALRREGLMETHQGIAVTGPSLDDPGQLLDGQHRLLAIMETGISATMWVAFEADPATFNVIDRGAPRSLADLLTIRGYKNARSLVAPWQLAWCWEHGNVGFSGPYRDDQIADLVERYPAVTSMELVSEKALGVTRSLLTFINFIVDQEAFMAGLLAAARDGKAPLDGQQGYKVGEILVGRNRAHRKMDKRHVMALVTKARNDHQAGEAVPSRGYSFRTKEAFPKPTWDPPVPFDIAHAEDDED